MIHHVCVLKCLCVSVCLLTQSRSCSCVWAGGWGWGSLSWGRASDLCVGKLAASGTLVGNTHTQFKKSWLLSTSAYHFSVTATLSFFIYCKFHQLRLYTHHQHHVLWTFSNEIATACWPNTQGANDNIQQHNTNNRERAAEQGWANFLTGGDTMAS